MLAVVASGCKEGTAAVAGHTGMTGGPCVGAVTDYVSTARRGGGR